MRGLKQNILLKLLAVTLLTTFSQCRPQRGNEDRFSDLRSKIPDFLEDENVPSVSVAVAQDGKIIWEESFGWANREKQIKATPNTMYELASIAKVFTATGLMVLKEKGLVDLDAPVETYLGGTKIRAYDRDASGVTLRRLVHHTSGLPMYWGAPSNVGTNHPYSRKEMFDRYAVLAFRPGERELYSNLGNAMVASVIEKVSKQRYATFLKENVFLPLGMTRTMQTDTPETTDECARQYLRSGEPWVYDEGTYASAHDLLRFGMFHLKNHLPDQKAIISDSTIDLMQTSVDPFSDFRLPWLVWEYEGFRALVFTGASGTIIALIPEANLAVVVLANRLQADTPRICKWICKEMLDDFDESRRIKTHVQTHRTIRPGPLSRNALAGVWKGTIKTSERVLPVEMSFDRTGSPKMRSLDADGKWGGWVETMPSLKGSYSDGVFSAYFPIRIPIAETKSHDHWTWVYVGLNGDTLSGYAVAHAAGGPHFGLPYYIKLEREKLATSR
jgi:CubicO group peptidase (beta-lactamase class C family)